MQNQFLSSKTTALNAWKTTRAALTATLDDMSHLKSVVEFWSLAPLSARVIDWDEPQLWPDPWKLVHEANFDESSVALGHFYTLLLAYDQRWHPDRMQLMLVKDKHRSLQRIILDIDDRWLLNLDYNTVVDKSKLKSKFWIQQKYKYDGKHHSILS